MPRKYDEDLSKFLNLTPGHFDSPNMNNIFVNHNGHKLSIAQHYHDHYTKPIVREIYCEFLDAEQMGIVHYDQTLDGLIEALQEVKFRIERGRRITLERGELNGTTN
jgi:hypothetical protein